MTTSDALHAAARYVEEHKASLAWDGPEMPSDKERDRLVAEVSALGHEFDSLAAASETARVYRREVGAVVGELQRRGLNLPPKIAQAIDDAFNEPATAPKAARTKHPARDLDGSAVAVRHPAV